MRFPDNPPDTVYMDKVAEEEETTLFASERQYRWCIEQIHAYMTFNRYLFGILSTYDFSFFLQLKPNQGGELLVSRPVGRREVVKCMTEFFLAINQQPAATYGSFQLR